MNNEVALGRAYQPHHRQPMDLTCSYLETEPQEKTTNKKKPSYLVECRNPCRRMSSRHGLFSENVHQGGGDRVPDSITHLLSIQNLNVDDFHVSVPINI